MVEPSHLKVWPRATSVPVVCLSHPFASPPLVCPGTCRPHQVPCGGLPDECPDEAAAAAVSTAKPQAWSARAEAPPPPSLTTTVATWWYSRGKLPGRVLLMGDWSGQPGVSSAMATLSGLQAIDHGFVVLQGVPLTTQVGPFIMLIFT